MDGNIRKFQLDSKDVKVKEILKGDFLELELYGISDANPNVNRSHFVLDGMYDAIPTIYNKPVLGFFNPMRGEYGDFEAHNDNGLHYDKDMETMYYDYNSSNSERVLGVIRESDYAGIEEDENGLHWLKFSCCLWCAYSYKAVKSLLKSRGGKSSVSVEVEVLQSYYDDNNIEHIQKFKLIGVTILGQKVRPGIEGANLSVRNFASDEDWLDKHKYLKFAYSALDEYNKNKLSELTGQNDQDSNKEFSSNQEIEQDQLKEGGNINPMENEDMKKFEAPEEDSKEEPKKEEEACGCEEDKKEEEAKEENPSNDEKDPSDNKDDEPEDSKKEEESCGCKEEEAKEENPDEKGDDSEAKKEEESCGKCAESCEKCAEDPDKKDEEPAKEEEACGAKEDEGCQKCSAEQFVSKVDVDGESMDINGLLEKYTELKKEFSELKESVHKDAVQKLINFGQNMVDNEVGVDAESKADFTAQINAKCEADELVSEDAVQKFAKTLFALYFYDKREIKEDKEVKEFSAPIEATQSYTEMKVASQVADLKEAITKLNNTKK